MQRAVSIALTVVTTSLVVSYPILVYIGISRFDARSLALLLLVLLLPMLLLRLRGQKRAHLKAVLPLPLGVASLLLFSAAINDHRAMLALPVLINAVLFLGFATTLGRDGTPLIERFARMQAEDLSEVEVRYCRTITIIWCGFLSMNALVCLALALTGSLTWWTLYTGGLSYAAMGLLFAGEYLYRKYRFRRYGEGWHDKVFAKVLPAPANQMDVSESRSETR